MLKNSTENEQLCLITVLTSKLNLLLTYYACEIIVEALGAMGYVEIQGGMSKKRSTILLEYCLNFQRIKTVNLKIQADILPCKRVLKA